MDRILNHRSLLKGKTALMICAKHRMWGMCRHICKLGASTDICDFNGHSAARIAYDAGWTDIGEWLQKTRAIGPHGITTYSDSTNEKKERIATGQLRKAIESGELIAGDDGWKLGCKLLAGDMRSRAATPSSPSSRSGSPTRKGRGPSSSRERSTGGTPEEGSPSSASAAFNPAMFAEGSMIEINGKMVEPLYEVPMYLKLIAEGKANPDTELSSGTTALIRACYEGNLRVIKLLVENGCDVNFDNNTGQTPLMSASKGGNVDVAKFLLSQNAKLATKDTEGRNAIAYANKNGNQAMVDFLVSARLRGPEEAIRRVDNPDEDEAEEDIASRQKAQQEALLLQYGATPIAADDGDYDSWKWRLPGIVNREYVHEEEPSSSDDSDEEERKAKGIGDKGVVKVRCCKCTLYIPCKHYKTFHEMWQKNPDGVGYKWGLRAKNNKKKLRGGIRSIGRGGRPGSSQAGFDWRSTKDAKDEIEVTKKENEKKMRAAFDAMDVNKDGNLSKQEVKAALCFNKEVREILELPDTASDDFDELYAKIDADNSMAVSYEEFHTYFAKKKEDLAREKRKKMQEEHFLQKLEAAYRLVDINGDGDVSKTEMLMAIQSNYKIQDMLGVKGGGVSKEEFEKIYSKIDEDGSDSIDFQEFKLFFVQKRIEDMNSEEKAELCHRKAFNLMDMDGSGTLNKTEILLAVKENCRIQSLMGVGEGIDSADFEALYKIIDADGSREVDFEEFQDFFRKKAQDEKKRKKKASSAKGGAGSESDTESVGGRTPTSRTPKGYGSRRRTKKKTTFSAENELANSRESTPKKKGGGRHSFFNELGKKRKKKEKSEKDAFDDGKPRDMYGWQGLRGELDKEESRIQEVRKECPLTFIGLNCDFGGKRYVYERCVVCSVGFARVKLMPDGLCLCDRCVLDRFIETRSFCRLVALDPQLVRAKPKKRNEELEVFNEPDEIQLVSFYIGQKRYDDAERMINVLLEKQSDVVKNGGIDDVAIGFTLRAMGGFEEARGRLPLARAHRENSMVSWVQYLVWFAATFLTFLASCCGPF